MDCSILGGSVEGFGIDVGGDDVEEEVELEELEEEDVVLVEEDELDVAAGSFSGAVVLPASDVENSSCVDEGGVISKLFSLANMLSSSTVIARSLS